MATQSQPQLVRLAEVADTIGAPLGWVVNTAGRHVDQWWTGEPACDFATAAKIADEWASNQAAAFEVTRKYEAEREAKIEREREELRRAAAERAKREPRRVLHGVEVSLPGDPLPAWMGDE
jgi:hypothetical protein